MPSSGANISNCISRTDSFVWRIGTEYLKTMPSATTEIMPTASRFRPTSIRSEYQNKVASFCKMLRRRSLFMSIVPHSPQQQG